jgi:hypothetical protein
MQAHPYQLSEKLSLGAELRLFYIGMDFGDGMPLSEVVDDFDNALLLGTRLSLNWYPTDFLTIVLEPEFRYKSRGWEEWDGFNRRLWQGFLAFDFGRFQTTLGMQLFSFGQGAALDDRFLGASFGFDHKKVGFSVFGGLTYDGLRRSGTNCLFEEYTSTTAAWKTISHNLGENFAVGATFSLKVLRPWRMILLYLLSFPHFEHLRSHTIALDVGGPLKPQVASLHLEPLLFIDDQAKVMLGLVGDLRLHLHFLGKEPLLRIGAASSFLDTPEQRLRPVFENLSWGFLKRYSLYHGFIGMARLDWTFEVKGKRALATLKPFAHYYIQRFDFKKHSQKTNELLYLTDELDAGIAIGVNRLYNFVVAFVGLNLASDYEEPSLGAYVEARIVFGE